MTRSLSSERERGRRVRLWAAACLALGACAGTGGPESASETFEELLQRVSDAQQTAIGEAGAALARAHRDLERARHEARRIDELRERVALVPSSAEERLARERSLRYHTELLGLAGHLVGLCEARVELAEARLESAQAQAVAALAGPAGPGPEDATLPEGAPDPNRSALRVIRLTRALAPIEDSIRAGRRKLELLHAHLTDLGVLGLPAPTSCLSLPMERGVDS